MRTWTHHPILIGDQAVGGEITVANVIDGNAKQWTATYKMGSAAETDRDGTISVAMTYTDLAGNSGTVKSQTDLANLMVYDKVAPSFEINNATTVVISSNNTGSNSSIQAGSRAKIGDNLSLLFKITDVGGIPGSDDENFYSFDRWGCGTGYFIRSCCRWKYDNLYGLF